MGKSDSGKSTLLNIIGGLDRYEEGEIIINSHSSKIFTETDWDAYRNTYVGFVFQEFYLIDRLTVGENIAFALELQGYNKDNINERIKKILHQVELDNYENRKISEISGGEKQRIAIARVKNPQIILADEPTGNLVKLSKDRLVIMVTHDRDYAKD